MMPKRSSYEHEMDVYRNSMTPIPEEDHHDPPLGEEDWLPVVHSNVNYWDEYTKACPDCHYPFDGDGWVLCEEHKEEE